MKTLNKIKQVQEISFTDLQKTVRYLGGEIKQGEGSCVKIYLRDTVTTLHCKNKVLKHGIVRTFRNTLNQLNLI